MLKSLLTSHITCVKISANTTSRRTTYLCTLRAVILTIRPAVLLVAAQLNVGGAQTLLEGEGEEMHARREMMQSHAQINLTMTPKMLLMVGGSYLQLLVRCEQISRSVIVSHTKQEKNSPHT
jgi:hypothetical protein